jgi:DNA-directed RNA polymerase subunit H (RpoH/RPB5)
MVSRDIEYEEQYDLDLLRKRALKAREVSLQMLRDRGYVISKEYIKVNTVLPYAKDLYIQGESDSLGPIGVFWTLEDKVRTEFIRSLILDMDKLKLKRAIMISPTNNYTSGTKKVLLDILKTKKWQVETFDFSELQYNPIRHELIPKYKILTKEEETELKEAYQIQDVQQLPIMAYNDIMSRYLGLSRNRVVQFIRPDKTINYRLVW